MRIVGFHPGALGDVVNTLPALAALQRQWPRTRLTLLAQTELAGLLAEADVVQEGHSLELPGLHTLFTPDLAPPDRLAEFLRGFDLAVSWMRGAAAVFPRRLAAFGLRAVFHPGPFPPPAGRGPASRYYAEPLKTLGIKLENEHPHLPLAPEQREAWLARIPDLRPDGYLAIHPGSGSPKKNWPAENFARLGQALAEKTKKPVVVIEGPADAAAVGAMIGAAGHAEFRLLKNLSLQELAAILAGAALVAANDSGVAHLAGAVGTPTVAVFAASDPAIWAVNQPGARNLPPDQATFENVLAAAQSLM